MMKWRFLKVVLYLVVITGNAQPSLLYAAVTANQENTQITLPEKWEKLQPILNQRVQQKQPKMKLTQQDAASFEKFLNTLTRPTPNLLQLEPLLPKTTLELLRSVQERQVSLIEAEKMADYLFHFTEKQHFQNVAAFDENTSHIIGREWSEIDYTGEGMTWQGQQKKYQPYGITHFKSEENLIKFFQVESRLPYFKKIYRPT